jgi:hypothetical protein
VADAVYADLELSLRAAGSEEYAAELRFLSPGGAAEAHLVGPPLPQVRLQTDGLLAAGVSADPEAYGVHLTRVLFADPRLREAVGRARAIAVGAGTPLRVRLRLDAGDPALHALAWETLRDPDAPEAGLFLFTSEMVPVSRYLDSPDLAPVERRPPGALRALVAVANPTDLAAFRLAPVDAETELARLQTALAGVGTTVLGGGGGGLPATLANLVEALRDGPDVLCLVCHGTLLRDGSGLAGEPYLWLEREDGTSERVAGAALVDALRNLPRRPALVVLGSCLSAGRPDEAGALAAVGPRLAGAGVGAVVAMQGDLTQATAARLLPVFFAELRRDGCVDRALAAAQVNAYLASAGPPLAALRAAVQEDAVLRELATSPLLLSVMALTYQGAPAEALPTGGSAEDRQSRLFAAYVERMFARRGPEPRYPKEQTVRWLAWLAGAKNRQGQTVFYLERLQPEWLPSPALLRRYTLTDRVGGGLTVGLAAAPVAELAVGSDYGRLFGPAAAMVAGLLGGNRETHFGDRWPLREVVRDVSLSVLAVGLAGGLLVGLYYLRASGLAAALAGGLVFGLLFGLAAALAGGLSGGPGVGPRHIAVVETLRWSFPSALRSAAVGLLAGLLGGLLGGLGTGLFAAPTVGLGAALGVGLDVGGPVGATFGVLGGLLFGLIGGLTRGAVEDEQKALPNQGIRRSARAALAVGLAAGLIVWLAFGLTGGATNGILMGLPFGLAAGLAFGGYACLSHCALRLVLWRSGALPLDCVRFLDSAADRLLLRKAGGGYLFVHRLLQEHFAAQSDGEGAGRPQMPVKPRRVA